ncbi:unnamed protein product [Gadus morhua 'NCC']
MTSSLAAVAAGLELRGLRNRPLKREANSEIRQIPTKKKKIRSHHPEVVLEKLDSSYLSSNTEIDGYPEGLQRLEIEDHGSVSPASGNLHNLEIWNGPSTDVTSSSVGDIRSSAIEEHFNHNTTTTTTTTSSFLKTHSKGRSDGQTSGYKAS